MDDMTANTMGSGIPSMVNFEDQTLTNSNSDIGLASKVDPPMVLVLAYLVNHLL